MTTKTSNSKKLKATKVTKATKEYPSPTYTGAENFVSITKVFHTEKTPTVKNAKSKERGVIWS